MSVLYSNKRSIESIRGVVEGALEELILKRMSAASDQTLMTLAKEVLLAGGKRFRPIVGILAFEASGGEDRGEILDLALSSELIHTATLVHDDINDQAKTRRGQPTIHATHGTAHAIIAGDYLFALGFELGARYNSKVVDMVGASCVQVASGELLQFKHIGDLSTKPEDYYSIIDGKTAGPFATGCSCAAIVAGASEEDVEAMWGYGMELGRAFQLVDDLLDLTGDESIGKPRGSDVYEGKMTLPIIYALTTLYGADREQLADILTNFSDYRLSELTELLDRAGSFQYARMLISNHVERALENLSRLSDSNAKELLIEIAKKSESRTT